MGKRKILVVDDEQFLCDDMREILERKGCEVFTALKSEEAWDIFQKESPDACCIDVHMVYSEFDGIELLRRIRDFDKDAMCIMFTVDDEPETVAAINEIGTTAYYRKPVNGEVFRELIGKLVEGVENK